PQHRRRPRTRGRGGARVGAGGGRGRGAPEGRGAAQGRGGGKTPPPRRSSIPGPVLACAQARRYLGSPSSAPRYGRSAYASRFADTPQVGRIAFLRRCRRFIRATPESACLDRCRCLRGRPARPSAPGARTLGRMASASPGAQPAAPLDAARLRAALLGDAADAGRPSTMWTDIRVVAETGSTNEDVLKLAAGGAPEGLVIAAEAQTAGKG